MKPIKKPGHLIGEPELERWTRDANKAIGDLADEVLAHAPRVDLLRQPFKVWPIPGDTSVNVDPGTVFEMQGDSDPIGWVFVGDTDEGTEVGPVTEEGFIVMTLPLALAGDTVDTDSATVGASTVTITSRRVKLSSSSASYEFETLSDYQTGMGSGTSILDAVTGAADVKIPLARVDLLDNGNVTVLAQYVRDDIWFQGPAASFISAT